MLILLVSLTVECLFIHRLRLIFCNQLLVEVLKYVNTGIVFQEIPDEVTLAVNISNCPCHCPGLPLDTDAIDDFAHKFGSDITCIAFMGGDNDPKGLNVLAQYIHEEHPQFKVAWYSGRLRIPSLVCKTDFDYIKIGPYIRHLGPLNNPTTNQRLYRKTEDNQFEDITARFWKK